MILFSTYIKDLKVLAEALRNLETRTLEATGIHIESARMKSVLAELNLVY